MKLFHFGIQAALLFGFWLLLSGHYDVTHLLFGGVSVGLVLWLNRHTDPYFNRLRQVRWWPAATYPFFLFGNIIIANLQVAYLILHPKMPIDPVILRFPTLLSSGAAKVVLGNSITLTPGTITIDIQGQDFEVHALAQGLAESLMIAREQNRIAQIFGDAFQTKPPVTIRRTIEV